MMMDMKMVGIVILLIKIEIVDVLNMAAHTKLDLVQAINQ